MGWPGASAGIMVPYSLYIGMAAPLVPFDVHLA